MLRKAGNLLLLSILFLMGGCGYHFIDSQPLSFPNQASKLNLKKVVNPTQETWIEGYVRNFLAEEISKRSSATLTNSSQAELFLTIYLDRLSTSEKTKGENDTTLKYSADLSLRMIFNNAQGEKILETRPVSYTQSYTSEGEKKEAIEKALKEALRLSLNQLGNNDF